MTKETYNAVLRSDPHVVICRNEREAYALFDLLAQRGFLWMSGEVLDDSFTRHILPYWDNDAQVFALFVYPKRKRCSYLLGLPQTVTSYAGNQRPPIPVVRFSDTGIKAPAVSDSDIAALFGGDFV